MTTQERAYTSPIWYTLGMGNRVLSIPGCVASFNGANAQILLTKGAQMKTLPKCLLSIYAFAAALIWFDLEPRGADACTGIRLRAKDGTVVQARTLEWGAFDLESRVIIVSRGQPFVGSTADGKPGTRWEAKYGFAGLDALDKPFAVDGVNERGLYIGAFYFPGFAEYEPYDPKAAGKSIGPLEFVNWVLSQIATVEELSKRIHDIKVVPVVEKAIGIAPPLHFIVTDTTGNTVVLEHVNKGELKIHHNPLGVITNAPHFEWHLLNLRNYVNLSPVGLPQRKLSDLDFGPFGVGAGMLGLPGDFTPPSRFIRAVAFTKTALPLKDADRTVNEAFRILDNFNIPLGAVVDRRKVNLEALPPGSTQWTVAVDLKNRIYYFHTMHNRRIRKLDLKGIDFTKGGIRYLPLDKKHKQDIEDITPSNN
jgi:choloylglycine hydrolase